MGIKIIQKSLWPVIALLALVWVSSLSAQETDLITEQIAWSPDGTMIAIGGDLRNCDSGSNDPESLIVIDVNTMSQVFSIPDTGCSTHAVSWNPDSTAIAFVGYNGLNVWDVTAQQYDSNISVLPLSPAYISWSPNGNYIAFAEYSGFAGIIDVQTAEISERLEDTVGSIVVWSSDSSRLFVDNLRDHPRVFSIPSGAIVEEIDYEPHEIVDIDWNPNGEIIAIYRLGGANPDTIHLLNTNTWQDNLVISLENILIERDAISDITLSPNHDMVAAVSFRTGIYIWDTITGNLETTLEQEGISAIDWSPDGSRLAYVPSGDDDELVGFLDDFSEAAP
ncbi:MAG: PD40 domain-containing protein [Anaerolineaceae bacterium]|nr:PD40 domain-containing protein [Anaerolineaceae bacterium]